MSDLPGWLDRDDGLINYGEPTYWERRYETDKRDFGESFRHDWYLGFDKLIPTIESFFEQPTGQRILTIGCGHSEMPARMHAMGYRCITATDISPTIITQMQQQDMDKEGLEYAVVDARKMDGFADGVFDCIFDKACADALYCGFRSSEDVLDMCLECCRVLRPGGVFLCVSHGHPKTRMYTFGHNRLQWKANAIPLPETEAIFVYACTKFSREEIGAVERRRQDELKQRVAVRKQGKHAFGRRYQGVMAQNPIAFARAPHEIDAASERCPGQGQGRPST